jgi:hypothetical protein
MEINFGQPVTPIARINERQAVDKPRTSRQPDLNIRIRYNKRLGKLLRTFDDLSIIQLDLDQTISYVLSTEIEKV